MVQTTCCGEGQECIVKDVSGLADPCMASCNVFYRLPDGSIWLLNKDGDGYLPVFVANDETKVDWNADLDSPTGIANRPFKAIGYGLKIDGSGNLVIDELVLPKPDWNETSTTSKDYIANKPFQTIGDHLFVEDGALNVCLENHKNELPNSTWNLGKPPWDNGAFVTSYEIVEPEADKPDSHILHAIPRTITTQQMFQRPHPIAVTAGDVITVAFDFKDLNWTQSSNLMVMRVFPERDTPQSQANSLQNVSWNSNTFGITGETTEFRRLVHSFTVTATGFLNVIPYNSDSTGNYEQWYREIMVIKGKECEMPDRWYPYFFDVPTQVQSDWNETDGNSPAFIKNKPTIPEPTAGAHTITLEGSPLDLTVGDHTFSAYDSITEEMDFDFNVTVAESNWDDSLAIRRLMFLEDTIDKSMEVTTYRLVAIEYSLPENNFTIDGVMTYQNVGGTFVYTLKVSATKGGSNVDLSNYVTLDTAQTITGKKVFTGLADFKTTASTGQLQVAQRLILADDAGTSIQTQGVFWMNPRLTGQASNGFSVGMGFGGLTILGGGESHRALLTAIETPETIPPALPQNITGGSEHAIIVGDSNVYIGSGYQNGGATGNWWRFGTDGKIVAPDGSTYVTSADVDLSNYVTLNTEQTIDATKHWGEIITTGQGENGQVTTLNPDGSVTQIQKIAGSNQYTEIEIAYGQVRVSTLLSDGTPLRNAILTETGVHREIDRGVHALSIASDWEVIASQCYIANSTLVVSIDGARPKSTIDGNTGGIFKTIATLPEATMKDLLTHNWNFEWSQYGGGATTYAGRLDMADGALKLYLMPPTNTINNNDRFSISLAIPIIK